MGNKLCSAYATSSCGIVVVKREIMYWRRWSMMDYMDSLQGEYERPCIITHGGRILVEPKVEVDRLYRLSNMMCQVLKDGKYGYIDSSGALVIPFQFQEAYPFSDEGLAFVVGEDGLGGYIDKRGRFVIDPIYDTGSIFKFGFAAVSRNGRYYYINRLGNKAVNADFLYAGAFADCGLAKVVTDDGRHQLMDTNTRVVLTLKLGNELEDFPEKSRVTKFRSNDGRESMINAAGQIITGFFDALIISPYCTMNPFKRNGLWGFVNDWAEEVIPNVYKRVSVFDDDKLAFVRAFHPFAENQEEMFYINMKDEIVPFERVQEQQAVYKKRFNYVAPFFRSLAFADRK